MSYINILILHSASVSIIEKFCKQCSNDNLYVCTYNKNKGIFSEFAKEIYFKDNSARINTYQINDELEEYTKKLNIDKVVFITSNENAENYENVKVLYNCLKCTNKVLLNSKLEEIILEKNFNNYINEIFYENEEKILKAYTKGEKRERKIKSVKKIMFIYDSFYVGGVTKLIYEWIKKINNRYEVVFSCYSNGAEIEKFKNINNLKLYVANKDLFESNAELEYYHYLKKIMINEKPDVVLISGVSTFLPSMLASIDSEVPKIYPIINIRYLEIFGSIKIGSYLRHFESYYNSIITVSKSVKDSIVNLNIDAKKIKVIYGTSIDINSIKNNNKTGKDERKIISCICRLSKEKGIDTLIEAISKISLEKYNNFQVNIVGDGDEKEYLMQLTKDLRLDNIIKFLGYRNDVENILNRTYISVLASHHEGLPLSILESMAYKKMVIATNIDGIPEIIRHNYNGFLIEENDSTMLSRYIEKCLDDYELVERMNENAYKVIKEEFNIDICINKIIDLIEGE